MTSKHELSSRATISQTIIYSLPVIPVYFLYGPMFIVQGIYAKYFGITLTTIASVLLISRLFDAFTDPLVGYFCDSYYRKTGTRKPFVITGSLLFVVSSYYLFVPLNLDSASIKGSVDTAYFLIWFLAFYFSFTLFEIPHLTWGGDLSADSSGKNTIFGIRTIAMYFGLLLFYTVPLLPLFDTSAYTPRVLQLVVYISSLLTLPLLYICFRKCPDNSCLARVGRRIPNLNLGDSKIKIKDILNNKPFLSFLAIFFFFGTGGGMWFALQFIYIDAFLGMGEYFSWVSIIGLSIGSILTAGIWIKLANRFGKKATWILGVALYAFSILVAGCFTSDNVSVSYLTTVIIFNYAGLTAMTILAPSLLADINDYSAWKFGVDHAAMYFSIKAMVSKANVAVGGALGLGLAGMFGFNPASEYHSEEQVRALKFAASWLPAAILILSAVIMFKAPIGQRRHKIISRRLDRQRLASTSDVNIIPF